MSYPPCVDVLMRLSLGPIVDSVNLTPILYKRLHIEGSTLRSRSPTYQKDLVAQ
jgi:hypothetical protein